MKIMLILPKFETHIITPPLGLGYLASSLRNAGHKVILLDCNLKNISPTKFSLILKKEKPDIVGVNAMTTYYSEALKYINEAKKQNIITFLGGPHITALPERSLKESNADFIFVGEAEKSIVELVNALENKKNYKNIKGIGYKDKNKLIINKRPDLIENLDSLPMPAWDLMNPEGYPIAPHGAFVKRFPVAPVITTRGCPFNCTFCASKCIWMQRLRFRNPQKVVDEIEMLHKKFNVKEFHFEDDNFTANKKHAMEVCREIIRRKLNIVWACPNGVRIDRLDRELLACMKKSGCYLLAFGIESGNQNILDNINKKLELEKVPEILKMVKESGIETWGFFILGLPNEDMDTINNTINFAVNNSFDRAQFCIFTPLPGSDIFNQWNKQGNLDWKKFNFFNIVYTPENMTPEDLKKLHKKAFRKFYLRPRIMFNMLKNLKAKQIKWLAKRAMQYGFLKNENKN